MKIKFLTLVLFLPLTILAAVPNYMNFQGYLKDQTGQNLSNGIYSLRFSVYDDGIAGTTIWGPQYFDDGVGPGHGAKVVVVNGHFNTILGPQDDGSLNVATPRNLNESFGNNQSFIEVSVCSLAVCTDQDYNAILPRQQILSTPYAFNAETVKGRDLATEVDDNFTTLNNNIDAVLTSLKSPSNLRFQASTGVVPGTFVVAWTAPIVSVGSDLTADPVNGKVTINKTGVYFVELNTFGDGGAHMGLMRNGTTYPANGAASTSLLAHGDESGVHVSWLGILCEDDILRIVRDAAQGTANIGDDRWNIVKLNDIALDDCPVISP